LLAQPETGGDYKQREGVPDMRIGGGLFTLIVVVLVLVWIL
jgi:hypothetical protein